MNRETNAHRARVALVDFVSEAIRRADVAPSDACLVVDSALEVTTDQTCAWHTVVAPRDCVIPQAEGVKAVQPKMTVVAVVDGVGSGINVNPLAHAARREVPLTVIVWNGAHARTRPLDVCEIAAIHGASYVARCAVQDGDVTDHVEAALRATGFSLVDVWDGLSDSGLPIGILCERSATDAFDPPLPVRNPPSAITNPPNAPPISWHGRTEIRIAGSTGQGIRRSVRAVGNIMTAGGLFAMQLDDAGGRGFSVSELIIDHRPIRYGGVDDPSLIIVLSQAGIDRLGDIGPPTPKRRILVERSVDLPAARLDVERFDITACDGPTGRQWAVLATMIRVMIRAGWVEPESLLRVAEANMPHDRDAAALAAVRHAAHGV